MEKITLEKFYRPNFKTIEIYILLKDVELFIYHSHCFEYRINNNRRGKKIYHEEIAKMCDGDKTYTSPSGEEFPYKNDYYISHDDFNKIIEYVETNNIRTCYAHEIYGV
jgi:hypothetical protein